MTPWRHHLRRARFFVLAIAAGVVIAVAIAMGAVQVLLPLATRYPNFIARQLSARLHRPVKFAAVRSEWQPSGPLLVVTGLTLGPGRAGGEPITVPHAALKFDFGAWLRPAHRWITLRLSGVELRIDHTAKGWSVVGFGTPASQARAPLQSLPVDLDLRDLSVDIVDDVTGRSWRLFAPRLEAVNVGDTVRFGGRIGERGTAQTVTIAGRSDTAARDYELYVATRDLDLATAAWGLDLHGYALRSGRADVQLWGRWQGGKLASLAARCAVRGLLATAPGGRSVSALMLAGVLRAQRVADGWDVAWRGPGKPHADIDTAGGALVRVRGHAGAWRVSAAVRAVDATPWLSLLAAVPGAPQALAGWAAHAQPHLRIDSAALAWREGGNYDAVVRFSDLHADATGVLPGVALTRGTLRADRQALSLQLPPQAATLALTHVFHQPFVFTRFGGTFVAWREGGRWNAAADGLRFDTGSLAGNAQAHLVWLGHGKLPFLSAYATLDHAQVPDAKRFWPYRSMPQSLVAWLDRALVAGKLTSGRIVVRGDLGDWPFLDHQGRFEAAGTLLDTTLDFADGWPPATAVVAAVNFIDNRMAIAATHATVRGVTVAHALATIPDLGHGVLSLDIAGSGTGAQLLDFVRHSPVGANAAAALLGIVLGGTGKFGIDLSIPLDDAANFNLAGKVELANADLTAHKWNLALTKLAGALVIAGKGFRADDLTAMFHGAPAKLTLAVGSGVTNPRDRVEASLATTTSLQALLTGYPDLDGLAAHASGVAPFRIDVNVTSGRNRTPAVPTLDVASNLAGIALDFPAPLDKGPGTTLPLDVTLRLPPEGAPLTVSLGDVLQVRGRLADAAQRRPVALAINFGSALPASAPASGLVVTGHASPLDLSGWIAQAAAAPSAATFPKLARADVSTGAARVFGTDIGALRLSFAAGAREDTIALDGPAVRGTVAVAATDLLTRGISADLQHLYWPEPPPKHPGPPPPPVVTSPIAPAAIPPLHVKIGDLRLGNARLGATTFASAPSAGGMHVSAFTSRGADFSIEAHGDWNGTRAMSQSHFMIDVASRDFGKTLDAFGFSGLVAGGADSHVRIDGTWPGSPSGFSLAWMSGTLGIEVGEGRILAVKPGLGRLLGLLSLHELPSRLLLRFGDVFKSGFGFDRASADFTLRGGNAYTQDMLITAPAARIAMRGRTGFRARDFDMTVDVTPHVGGTLPVVGAVVGGPVGAAAGFVVQGLIGKGLNKAAGTVYHVTGSWDKPKIESVGPGPASAASVAPPALAPAPASTAPPLSAGSAPAAGAAPSAAPATSG